MRVVVRRIVSILWLASSVLCSAQITPQTRTPPPQTTEPKPELGSATAPTVDKSAEAAKAPIGVTPMPTAAPVDPKNYEIGPEDILAIRVWREPELTTGVQVRPDGKITMALIGELQAAGNTPEQLKEKIIEKYSEFINKPEVMVSVQSVQSRRYYITGEVGRTGAFPLIVPTTVLEALTNAGGFKEFANTKKITILRKGQILKFNYNEVTKGKKMQQNIFVESGDYIIVP